MANIVRTTFSTFRKHPWLFLAVQVPEALLELIDTVFGDGFEKNQLAAAAVLFPLFCISASLTSAMTFCVILDQNEGKRPTLASVWRRIAPRFIVLSTTAMVMTVIILLGLAALIIPGFYFMAAYLFVPWLVVSSPKQPLSAYLYQSSRLVRPQIIRYMALMVGITALMLLTTFGPQLLSDWVLRTVSFDSIRLEKVISAILLCVPGLFVGSLIDIGLTSQFFREIEKAKEKNLSGGMPQ